MLCGIQSHKSHQMAKRGRYFDPFCISFFQSALSVVLVQHRRTRRRVEYLVTSPTAVFYLGWTRGYSKHQAQVARKRVFAFRTDHVVVSVVSTTTCFYLWRFFCRRLFNHEITHSTRIDCSMNFDPPRVSRTVAQTEYNPGSDGGNHCVVWSDLYPSVTPLMS